MPYKIAHGLNYKPSVQHRRRCWTGSARSLRAQCGVGWGLALLVERGIVLGRAGATATPCRPHC